MEKEALAGKIQEGEVSGVLKENSAHQRCVALCWMLTFWMYLSPHQASLCSANCMQVYLSDSPSFRVSSPPILNFRCLFEPLSLTLKLWCLWIPSGATLAFYRRSSQHKDKKLFVTRALFLGFTSNFVKMLNFCYLCNTNK